MSSYKSVYINFRLSIYYEKVKNEIKIIKLDFFQPIGYYD